MCGLKIWQKKKNNQTLRIIVWLFHLRSKTALFQTLDWQIQCYFGFYLLFFRAFVPNLALCDAIRLLRITIQPIFCGIAYRIISRKTSFTTYGTISPDIWGRTVLIDKTFTQSGPLWLRLSHLPKDVGTERGSDSYPRSGRIWRDGHPLANADRTAWTASP